MTKTVDRITIFILGALIGMSWMKTEIILKKDNSIIKPRCEIWKFEE